MAMAAATGRADMHILEEFELAMRRPHAPAEYVRVAVNETEAACIVSFNETDASQPPFRFVNELMETVVFHQKGIATLDYARPHSIVPFAWDEPLQPHVLVVQLPDGKEVEIEPDRVGEADPIDLGKGRIARPEVVADGPTRVLYLRPVAGGVIGPIGTLDTAKPQVQISVEISGIGVSVVDSRPREIVYLSVRRLAAEVTMTASDRKVKIEVGDIQLDNSSTVSSLCCCR